MTDHDDSAELAFRAGSGISAVSTLESALARLSDGTATADDVLTAIDIDVFAGQVLAALRRTLKAALVAWVEKNGEVTRGDVRYYVGTEKRTKCIDQKGTLTAVLDATGGDVDRLVDCLAAGAFKSGATSRVLDEDTYSKLFKTEEVKDLKTGKPKRVLVAADPRFMKQKG